MNKCKDCSIELRFQFSIWNHFWQEHSKCFKCDVKFESSNELRNHRREKHKSLFLCDFCDLCSRTKQNLKSHLELKHFYCQKCKEPYQEKSAYLDHLSSIHGGQNGSFFSYLSQQCKICKKVIGSKYLRYHLVMNHFACSHCDKTFPSKKEVFEHMIEVHDQKQLHCDICDYTTIFKSKLSRHSVQCSGREKSQKHKSTISKYKNFYKEESSKCNDCKIRFTASSTLFYHKWAKHQKCAKCDIRFENLEELKNHSKSIHGIKPLFQRNIKCSECDHSSMNSSNHKYHMTSKHNFCVKCDIKFEDREKLQAHMKRTHDSNEIHTTKLYKCELCGRKVSCKKTLQVHMLSLHSNKDLKKSCKDCSFVTENLNLAWKHYFDKHCKCFECNEIFSTKDNLEDHVNKDHSSIIKFCTICFKFNSIIYFNTHMRIHSNSIQCNDCQYKAKFQYSMWNHYWQSHSKCYKCEIQITTSIEFRTHMTSHDNVHMCHSCDFITRTVALLDRHKKSKHNYCKFCNIKFEDYNKLKIHLRKDHANIGSRKPLKRNLNVINVETISKQLKK